MTELRKLFYNRESKTKNFHKWREAMGYRMLIADDEKMIIQLIRQLGHWEELGIEIIDECYDGEDALESILRNRPDFVLSDIQMPVYDGIQLIERVREHDPDVLFILLSGYRYFEYARSAIQLNVVDYLLKPVDEEQLNEILEKVCRSIDEKRRQEADHETLVNYQTADENFRRKEFWEIILDRDRKEDRKFLTKERILEKFQIDFREKNYQVIYVDTNLAGILGTDHSVFSDKVKSYIESAFKGVAQAVHYEGFIGHVLVLNYGEDRQNEVYNAVSVLFYKIRDLNEIYGEFRLNIGCSLAKDSPEKLPDAFEEAVSAEWGHLVFFGNKVLKYEQVSGLMSFSPTDLISAEELQAIGECVRYLRQEELGQIFSEINKHAARYQNAATRDMVRTFLHIRQAVLEALPEDTRTKMAEHYYMAYQNARNFQNVFQNIYDMLRKYILEEQQRLNEKRSKPIEEAIRYIRKNYGNCISLEDAAEAANVSAPYLSKIFKEKMEIGFNDYLTKIRLEESQKLLADTNLSVKEIASSVGYSDEKYYSKLFKKLIGIKPTDYRRLYG